MSDDDRRTGMDRMEHFAELAKGSGTGLSALTEAAGIPRTENQHLSADEMKAAMLAIVDQGKKKP